MKNEEFNQIEFEKKEKKIVHSNVSNGWSKRSRIRNQIGTLIHVTPSNGSFHGSDLTQLVTSDK